LSSGLQAQISLSPIPCVNVDNKTVRKEDLTWDG
jgi:hypothetical protein